MYLWTTYYLKVYNIKIANKHIDLELNTFLIFLKLFSNILIVKIPKTNIKIKRLQFLIHFYHRKNLSSAFNDLSLLLNILTQPHSIYHFLFYYECLEQNQSSIHIVIKSLFISWSLFTLRRYPKSNITRF